MKLIDLNPCFVSHGGKGMYDKDHRSIPLRKAVGLSFDCPCEGECGRLYLSFENPVDGGSSVVSEHPAWKRTGETFEDMSLTPSIQRMSECRWHGYLTNGELVKV